ncbi:acetate--CoA ligase family protein [Bradyrhizobium sp. INPA01-394B]|uniref:Acetate--CoA ligase family protein n=1 Tax=Bradyrhizobium campsiandrae TaxID=1729892 RepID=A0ABR7U9J3_9BRAD|nr:acetate--CoA ligase family protein [Bradyrhizobium campsiandrae]MBC9878639.1 acetate--CoA ligase family protein [Bradyrhizobium campsiandrae]MBC9980632.1 acetate--CoA ligase family protein [Bradyrhizobium campsiandrae]
MSLNALFNPRSIAVVGASADSTKTSGLPVAFLRQQKFEGEIYPVNPRVAEIDGLRCYKSIEALPVAPDVAMVLLGSAHALGAVRELAAKGTKHAIVLAGGFGESGEEGQERQRQLLSAAGGTRILGPNTIGLVNVSDSVPLSASGALSAGSLLKGSVSVVSQSGGILGALLSRLTANGVGLSKLIATGNEADLEIADFVDYLADDVGTSVIALYIEAIRHPEKFRRAARRAREAGKKIVALKIGRSAAGARAAASHTGAMAGTDRTYDAFFRDLGIVRAQTFGDLVDIPAALATQPALMGRRVAILTSTGGAGTLIVDSFGLHGLEAPDPDTKTAEQLATVMPDGPASLKTNPIDVTLAGLQPEILKGCIETLLNSPAYDALVVIVGATSVRNPDLISNAIREAKSAQSKPLLAYVSPYAPEAVSRLTKQGVPTFSTPEAVTVVLNALWTVGRPLRRREGSQPRPAVDIPGDWHGSLDEHRAKSLFARFGVPVVREKIVANGLEAGEAARELGGRIVLKILSSTITHKSDVGGVAVGLDAATVGGALDRMREVVAARVGRAPEAFIVQEMVPSGGFELILGCHRDPLGLVLLLGMGGITAELMNDTVIRLLAPDISFSRDLALEMVQELRCWPLLDGYRGRARLDVEGLVSAIVAFAAMAVALDGRIVEAEINPMFVLPAGEGVCAADAVAVLTSGLAP